MILLDRHGRKYHKDGAGVIRRLDPKPWRGKAERRRVLANRRADREAARAAMED